jgi:site-specific DNA-adenine methylase
MKYKLGIPYMGSKRKLASDILQKITQRHSGITDFYDLFGGGGSISFTAIRDYRFKVHYNELNKHIYSLVQYLKDNKELEPKFYEWVTREEFHKQINKTNEEADWYSGFVMSCWSFGNSQSSYLYGADIEQQKRMLHELIVNKCKKSILEFEKITEVKVEDYFLRGDNVQERKNQFTRILKKLETNQFYRTFNQDIQNQTLFQQLARIQHLGAIQNLQNLQNLQITNTSYENVLINPNGNPIIYCDIPYKGTGEYKEGGFNHDAFYEWFANLDYPCYLSEYDAPFEKIEMFAHRSSLSATNNKKKVFESIFWNGKGEINKSTLF